MIFMAKRASHTYILISMHEISLLISGDFTSASTIWGREESRGGPFSACKLPKMRRTSLYEALGYENSIPALNFPKLVRQKKFGILCAVESAQCID